MTINKISITLRLPTELNNQLTHVSKALGFTKTNLIRLSIHEYLDTKELNDLETIVSEYDEFKYRMVLNVNSPTYEILIKQSDRYNLSVNKLLTYSSKKALIRYSKLIKKLGL